MNKAQIDLPEQWKIILDPISAENPCGPDARYSLNYDLIRLARQTPGDTFDAGMWARAEKKIDWDAIKNNCIQFLAEESKDIQVMAWLMESCYMTHDLLSFAQSHILLTELVVKYWSHVHPLMEDGDVELRISGLSWLLKQETGWLNNLAETKLRDTSSELNLHQICESIQHHIVRLDEFLTLQLKNDAPSFAEIKKILAKHIPTSEAQVMSPTANGAVQYNNVISTRDVAYDQLKEISKFLSQSDPHSPVPFILNTMVNWRNISFEDLLRQLPSQGASVYDLLKIFNQFKS